MTDQELICDARDHIANRYDTDYKLLIRCFEAVVDRFSALQAENAELRADLSRVEGERDTVAGRQKGLDDALRDMVCQYCSYDGKLDHEFMSAGEHAFDVLDLDYGAPVETQWRSAQGEG